MRRFSQRHGDSIEGMSNVFRLILRASLVLGMLIVLAVGALAVRLSIGPMEVGFLRGAIESGLSASNGSYRVKAKKVVVEWQGWDNGLLFVLHEVGVVKKGGATIASLPNIAIKLDAGSLVAGELAPRSIVIRRPKLLLRRSAQGRITLGIVQAGKTRGQRFVPGLLSALRGRGGRSSSIAKLTTIKVTGAHLIVEDAYLHRTWRTTNFSAELNRNESGIVADMSFNLLIRDKAILFKARGVENIKSGLIAFAFKFERLDPAMFRAARGPMAALRWVRLPLSGQFHVTVDRKFIIRAARFTLAGSDGRLQIPGYYSKGLPVKKFALKGRVSGDGSDMSINRLDIDFGGPKLQLVGRTRRVDNEVDFNGTVSMTGFPADRVSRYWPEGANANARKWVVANISDGRVNSLDVSIALKANIGKQRSFELRRLRGAFRYTNLTIRYFKHMPPVKGISGIATVDDRGMKFSVDRGTLKDLKIVNAKVDITGFRAAMRSLKVSARVVGKLQSALTIIDREPLGFARKIGVSPLAINGQVSFGIDVWVSLFTPITFQDVGIRVDADLSKVHWRKALFGLTLTKGKMKLKVNNRSMSVTANGLLEGQPATISWFESFKPQPVVRRMRLKGRFSTKSLKKLGVDTGGVAQGQFGGMLLMEGRYSGITRLTADLNVRDTDLKLPLVGITKLKGKPATLRARFLFQNQRLISIPHLRLTAPGLQMQGRATFYAATRRLRRLVISRLKSGLTDISIQVDQPVRGPRILRIRGKAIDLTRTIDMRGRSPDEPMPPTIIRASVKRVYFAPGRPFTNVKGAAVFDGRDWRSIDVTGMAGKGKVLVRLVDDSRRRRLKVRVADAGATLKALNVYDKVHGGTISVDAVINDSKGAEQFIGRAEMRKFRLRNAPAAARLLALASIRGISNLGAKDDGIAMDEFVAPVRFQRGLIVVRNARAVGSQIGVTLNGSVNLKTNLINLRGTIVPAYSINSLLGKLVASEKGSGLFAATYRIKGDLDAPKVTVNALAVLTPRILRRLRNSYTPSRNKTNNFNDTLQQDSIGR